MFMIYKFKLTIGVFLLICTCLPLGSCQKKQIKPFSAIENKVFDNEFKKPENNLPASEQPKIDYLIPVTQIDLDDPESWILFLALIWPIPVLLASKKICKSTVKKRVSNIIELSFSIFSSFIIYSFVFKLFYDPMIWGYITFMLINIYILLNLFEIFKSIERFRKKLI